MKSLAGESWNYLEDKFKLGKIAYIMRDYIISDKKYLKLLNAQS